MNKNLILTLTAVVLTTLCSCGTTDKENNGKDNLCQFNNIKQEKIYRYTDEEGDTFYVDNKVTAFWPLTINGKECPLLQQAILLAMTDSAELNTLDLAIDAMLKPSEFLEINPDSIITTDTVIVNGSNLSASEVTLRLQDMGDRLLTYHIHYYAYMARAAHGIYSNNYVTYDLKTEKAISLNDIIADTTLLRDATLKSIKQEYNYGTDELFLPDNGLLPLPKDFYFEGSTLHVVYQVYEIASYAQGMIDAPIYPYMLKPEEMKRLFTPYGLELIDYTE